MGPVRCLLIALILSMAPAIAYGYEVLFQADTDAPFAPTIGTLAAIYDPNDQDVCNTNISQWKSTRVQASATGDVTHFLIKIGANMTGVSVGFGVWAGSSNAATAPADLLIYGVYSSFTFDQGAGWYAIPFTSAATLSVTSGTYYDLAFFEQGGSSNFCRANNASPFAVKWGDSATANYDDPPLSGEWDVQYATDSAPWVMGLLIGEVAAVSVFGTGGTMAIGGGGSFR